MPQHSGLKQTLHCTIDYLHFSCCIHEAIQTLQSSNLNAHWQKRIKFKARHSILLFSPPTRPLLEIRPVMWLPRNLRLAQCFSHHKKKEKLAAFSAHPGHRPHPRHSIMWNSVGDFCNCCCMGIIRQHLHSRLCLIRPPEKSTVAFLLEPLYYCSCFEWAVFCFYVVDSLPVKTEARGSSDLPYPVKWMILSPVCQLLRAVLTENSTQGQAIVIMYLFQNNVCIRIKINNQQRLFQLLPH